MDFPSGPASSSGQSSPRVHAVSASSVNPCALLWGLRSKTSIRRFRRLLGGGGVGALSAFALARIGHRATARPGLRRLKAGAQAQQFGEPVRRVTDVLLSANVVAFIAQLASGQALTVWGAKQNDLIAAGQWWRLVTPVFLHANLLHLVMNNYALNNLGPLMELLGGHRRFLAVYSASALTGSVMSYLRSPTAAVGASGAIFGIGGAMAVFFLRHRDVFGPASNSVLMSLAQSLLINVAFGLTSPQIDNWGHFGGLAGGALFAYLLGPRWVLEKGQIHDRPPVPLLASPATTKRH